MGAISGQKVLTKNLQHQDTFSIYIQFYKILTMPIVRIGLLTPGLKNVWSHSPG